MKAMLQRKWMMFALVISAAPIFSLSALASLKTHSLDRSSIVYQEEEGDEEEDDTIRTDDGSGDEEGDEEGY